MGNENKKIKTRAISSGLVQIRNGVINAARTPAIMLQNNWDATSARLDSIYEGSRVVAIKYVAELKIEFPEATHDELLVHMQKLVLDTSRTTKNADLLVDSLTLYVCVALELSGAADLDILTRRKCIKLIENTRRANKTRKVMKQVETAARITAAIAALLPDKGKLSTIKKLGQDVTEVIAVKDVLQSQLVDAFENNGIKNPGQQATAKKVIADTTKLLEAGKLRQSLLLDELNHDQ